MTTSPASTSLELECPTCRARQSVANADCRRCKCDLRLVVGVIWDRERIKRDCLLALRDARQSEALALARRWASIDPSGEAVRWVVVARLLAGHIPAAVQALRRGLPPLDGARAQE